MRQELRQPLASSATISLVALALVASACAAPAPFYISIDAAVLHEDEDRAMVVVKSQNGPATKEQVDPYAQAACKNFGLQSQKFVKVECFQAGYCLWGFICRE